MINPTDVLPLSSQPPVPALSVHPEISLLLRSSLASEQKITTGIRVAGKQGGRARRQVLIQGKKGGPGTNVRGNSEK